MILYSHAAIVSNDGRVLIMNTYMFCILNDTNDYNINVCAYKHVHELYVGNMSTLLLFYV